MTVDVYQAEMMFHALGAITAILVGILILLIIKR